MAVGGMTAVDGANAAVATLVVGAAVVMGGLAVADGAAMATLVDGATKTMVALSELLEGWESWYVLAVFRGVKSK